MAAVAASFASPRACGGGCHQVYGQAWSGGVYTTTIYLLAIELARPGWPACLTTSTGAGVTCAAGSAVVNARA